MALGKYLVEKKACKEDKPFKKAFYCPFFSERLFKTRFLIVLPTNNTFPSLEMRVSFTYRIYSVL